VAEHPDIALERKTEMSKPKTRAEEIARDIGIKDGRKGNDECPYLTGQYAQCWREGHAQGKAEKESGGAE
jgi:ribosome modulation factor